MLKTRILYKTAKYQFFLTLCSGRIPLTFMGFKVSGDIEFNIEFEFDKDKKITNLIFNYLDASAKFEDHLSIDRAYIYNLSNHHISLIEDKFYGMRKII